MKKQLRLMLVLLFTIILLPTTLLAAEVQGQGADTVTQGNEGPAAIGAVPIGAAPIGGGVVTTMTKEDPLSKADALIEEGGLENSKKALDVCLEEVKKAPNDYRANWMAAMACREFGNETKKSESQGWEETCKVYGKQGMAYADKAIKLDPKKVEGYYWYGMNVGIYSDGVSILTALREGLKDKTQTSFETAYKIDKMYERAGAIIGLGRFWQVLPWPLYNKDKSMEYYREFQKTKFYKHPKAVEFNVYFGELLMENKKTKDEAKTLLEEVPKISSDKYWNKRAKELLAKL